MTSQSAQENGGNAAISFDPYSKRFRFAEDASLQGVIVEMSPGADAFLAKIIDRSGGEKNKQPIITGEIVDIVDHMDDTTALRGSGGSHNCQNKSSSPEQYCQQTIRHLQSKHAYQTQQLIHQHSTTRHDIENTSAVERKHYLEIMRLMKRQQEEQAEEFQSIIANQVQQMKNQQVEQFSNNENKVEESNSHDDVPNAVSNNVNITTNSTQPDQPQLHPASSSSGEEDRTRDEQQKLQNLTISDADENDHIFTDPTPKKTNMSSSTEQIHDGGNDIEDQNSAESDEETNSDEDDDHSSSSASSSEDDSSQSSEEEKEEEKGGVEDSNRSGRLSTDEGTRDGSLKSIRSGRSGRSARSGRSGKSSNVLTRDGSMRSLRSALTRESSLRSMRSGKSGQSGKSAHSETDEGTRDGSLRSARSGRSRQSHRSNVDVSERSEMSMRSHHSETDEGTRDGSLRSARSGRSRQSHRSNVDVSERSEMSMRSHHSETDEGTRDGSLRSARSGRSRQSRTSNVDMKSHQSETDEGARDGSLQSSRSGRSSRSKSHDSVESDHSSRSGSSRSGASDSDGSSRSGRSMQSDRSQSVVSRDGSVESGRASRSERSGRSFGSDRSESVGASRDNSVESARSNHSGQSRRSTSSSYDSHKESASEHSPVASEKEHVNNDEESSHYSDEVKESVVEKAPPKVEAIAPQRSRTLTQSRGTQRRKATKEEMAEIKEVMKDRSLSRAVRLEKVQQIKAKYAAAEEEEEEVEEERGDIPMEEAALAPPMVTAAIETQADQEEGDDVDAAEREQSKEEKAEIKMVKKDTSLSKKEKKKMIKKIKAKYDAKEKERVSATPDQEQVQSTEDDAKQPDSDKQIVREPTDEEKAEIKKIIKNKKLSEKEKKKKMKKVKAKYDAEWKERMDAVKMVEAAGEERIDTVMMTEAATEDHGSDDGADEGQDQDDIEKEIKREPSKEERTEIKKVMKDKNLSKKEKKKKLKLIKAKYDQEYADAKVADAAKENDQDADANEAAAAKETVGVAFQYTPLRSQRKNETEERAASPPPKEEEWQPAQIRPDQQNSNAANDQSRTTISTRPSQRNSSYSLGASNTNLSKDVMAPLENEELQTDRTPMKKLVKMMEKNDPLLEVLKLDGRKKIKQDDWELFFQSLENNTSLTHLSISRCDLTDEICVNLVLALVDNESLIALKLSSNKGLTDDTGKGFIKVLTQSNKTLKKLDLSKTKVSKKALDKIGGIMEKRDDQKRLSKAQNLRQSKILDLLSVSASDLVAAERKMSETGTDSDDEGIEGSVHSGKSGRSGKSGLSGKSGRRQGTRGAARGSQVGNFRASQVGGRGRGNPALRSSSVMRASITARTMAQLGGDSLGADTKKIKEQRKMRGECEDCGQRCFLKSMFKSTPLTIPNVVYEGRCLKCNPM